MEGTYTTEKVRDVLEAEGIRDFDLISLGEGKHIFSHVEWHMTGFRVRMDRLTDRIRERLAGDKDWALVTPEELKQDYAVPSAFSMFTIDTD